MKRREFISLLGGAVAAWPLATRAQQSERMRRVGVLMPFAENDSDAQTNITSFRQALQMLGWTGRRNVRIDYRWVKPVTSKARTWRSNTGMPMVKTISSRCSPLSWFAVRYP